MWRRQLRRDTPHRKAHQDKDEKARNAAEAARSEWLGPNEGGRQEEVRMGAGGTGHGGP